MTTEKELIRLAREGNSVAISELVETYQGKVYNMALRMCRQEEDALDLSQEIFFRVFRSLSKFREDSTFSTWLYRISYNMCIDFLRKEQKRVDLVRLEQENEDGDRYELPIVDYSADPQAVLEDKELYRAYLEALQKLPMEQREILILRDIDGFTYEEIAQIRQCSIGTIKSKLFRGREKLRSRFRY